MPQTWIFQSNPDHFDIDGYLDTAPGEITWVVRQYRNDISVGDQVFLWRSLGSSKANLSGVVAEAQITSDVEANTPDDPSAIPFWVDPADARAAADRVRMSLIRRATIKQILKRDWLKEDPILRDLGILKMAQGTNYPVQTDHGERLNALWSNTGRDWNYAEAVAGLWLYNQMVGSAVSRLPGSPVANVALAIGRAVSGVYNKVMNFRALDPRDERKGLPAGSGVDREVWEQFFDAKSGTIQTSSLELEFERLWPNADVGQSKLNAVARRAAVEDEAARLSNLTYSELFARLHARTRSKNRRPTTREASTRVFDRDPLVVAVAKKRAQNCCELPGCDYPQFIDKQGDPYIEVHHITPLADGGEDTIDNVACVCPSHHREAHLGANAEMIEQNLRQVRSNSKQEYNDSAAS